MLSRSFIWAEKTLLNGTEETLLNEKNQEYLLYEGIKSRNILLVQTLIRMGININQIRIRGLSPLQQVVLRNDLNMARVLLAAGANPNQVDEGQLSPLQLSVRCKNPKMVRVLLEARASVHTSNSHGQSPLWQAARLGYLEIVELLTDAGADVNQMDKNGRSPLWCPSYRNHVNVVCFLLRRGAKPDQMTQPECLHLDSLGHENALALAQHGLGLSDRLDNTALNKLKEVLRIDRHSSPVEILWPCHFKNDWIVTIRDFKNLPKEERSFLLTHTSIPLLNLRKEVQQIIGTWKAMEYFYVLELAAFSTKKGNLAHVHQDSAENKSEQKATQSGNETLCWLTHKLQSLWLCFIKRDNPKEELSFDKTSIEKKFCIGFEVYKQLENNYLLKSMICGYLGDIDPNSPEFIQSFEAARNELDRLKK